MKKLLFVFALLVFLSVPAVSKAFIVSPPIFDELVIEQGQSDEVTITLVNSLDEPVELFPFTQNFAADENSEEGKAILIPVEENFGLAEWLKPSTDKVFVEGKGEVDITVSIKVPENADPGGHYAVLFFSKNPPNVDEGVGIGENIGTLFLVTVPGDINESAEILDFSSDSGFYTQLPVNFDYRVKNNGSVHFKPRGEIEIKNLLGMKTKVDPNPKGGNALPNSVRHLTASWVKDENRIEKGGFMHNLSNEWHNFALGRYKANLNLIYGREGQTVNSAVTFWVFPWHVVLVFVILLVALIILIKGYNRLVVKSAQKKNKGDSK